MADAPLATVSATDLAASPQYQSLLADCREICNSARVAVLQYMWLLGERISREFDGRDEESERQVTSALERDLAIDRTTLVRAVQTYRRFDRAQVGDGSSPLLTWGKLRMLLPLPDELFDDVWQRILDGKLRTDEDVRLAIHLLKQDAGLLPASALGEAQPELFGVRGVRADKLRTLWSRAKPLDRCLLVRAMIPEMELEKAERPEALAAIRATREQLDEYERKLGEAGS